MSDTAYEERIVRTVEAFRRNRYDVSRFAERTAAADHLAAEIRGKRVGFGDSETLRALSLYERLSVCNEVIDPPRAGHVGGIEAFLAAGREALMTDVFLLSANAITEQGQIFNIDLLCRRHQQARPRHCGGDRAYSPHRRPAQRAPQGQENALREGWHALL